MHEKKGWVKGMGGYTEGRSIVLTWIGKERGMKCIAGVTLVLAAIGTLGAERVAEFDCTAPTPVPEPEANMGGKAADGTVYGANRRFFTRDGEPWFPVMGEYHYLRDDPSEWASGLAKMKALGCDVVATYALWNHHERKQGEWKWDGREDLRRFVQLAQAQGLKVWLRFGPYCNAEAKHGGRPDYVMAYPNQRSNKGKEYCAAAKRWYEQVAAQMKGLFVKDGGPIVGVQLENEFAYGTPDHIDWLYETARGFGMVAPYYTVTANTYADFASGRYLPLQGAYPYRFWCCFGQPTQDFLYKSETWGAMFNEYKDYYDSARFLVGFCEMGASMDSARHYRIIVPTRNAEALAQDTLGRGGNEFGYYMFHGGTQDHALKDPGGPISYYDSAPVSAFGRYNENGKGLKLIHSFVQDFAPEFVPTQSVYVKGIAKDPRDTKSIRAVARNKDGSGFILMSTFQGNVKMEDQRDVRFRLALPGGKTLTFPSTPFTLKAETSLLFPYNQTFGGVPLVYASAHPFARIGDTLFFYACEGIAPEFAFPAGTAVKGLAREPALGAYDGNVTVRPEPGLDSAFTVGKATYVTLTRAQAEQAWRLRLGGAERLVLTAASPYTLDGGKTLTLTDADPANLVARVYPAPAGAPREGLFGVVRPTTVPAAPAFEAKWEKKAPGEWALTVDALPKGADNLWLTIKYVGDNAVFLVDGQVYTDNLYNGEPWRIGLRRFFLDGKPHTFTVRVAPFDPKVGGLPRSALPRDDAEAKGVIRAIDIVPEIAVALPIAL